MRYGVNMTIPEVFERHARAILAAHPELKPRWSASSNGDGRELFIPKRDSSGFDVTVRAETYGLYPLAGGWHGAPWEPARDDPRPLDPQVDELCVQFLGFIRTLLSVDAILKVHYSRRRPYRWVLEYETELAGIAALFCGLITFGVLRGVSDTWLWLCLGGSVLVAILSAVLAHRALEVTSRRRALARISLWLSRATICTGLVAAVVAIAR